MAKQENTAELAQTDKSAVALSNPENAVRLDANDLRSLVSFDDAVRLLEQQFGTIADASHEIGDGFTMLDDKSALINTPFVMLQWTFAPGDYGAEYLIARVMTKTGDKFVMVDGGTGLCDQVRQYTTRTGQNGGLLVERGLRKSEYDNEHGHGITFYLNV